MSEQHDPMGDEAAEAALSYLNQHAAEAGKAKAQMIYMENWRKIVLSRLKRESPEKSETAREAWARSQPEYEEACVAQFQAVARHEELFWKRIAAEATLESWRTKSANTRGAERMR